MAKPDTAVERTEAVFDMMHVCPPQTAFDCIRLLPRADAAGWTDVDQTILGHKTYDNIWSSGDVMKAKTMVTAGIEAPVVAEHILNDIPGKVPAAHYTGHGSCPLTVDRGKIALADFSYGSIKLTGFSKVRIDGTKFGRAAWFLKERMLPPLHRKAMLKGREWRAKPKKIVVT